MSNIILATGGGIVILPKNREILKNAGLVVYLSSSVDQLLMRTAKSKTRPLLENSADRRKTITELVDARDVYYREVASLVVDTTGKKLHEVINIIKRENENVE
jgi:shikimate kinase